MKPGYPSVHTPTLKIANSSFYGQESWLTLCKLGFKVEENLFFGVWVFLGEWEHDGEWNLGTFIYGAPQLPRGVPFLANVLLPFYDFWAIMCIFAAYLIIWERGERCRVVQGASAVAVG